MGLTQSYEELEKRIQALEREAAEHKRLNRMLEASEKQLSQIIAGSSIPTFVIDVNHTVTHFNSACENLTGLSSDEIVGTSDQWKAFYSKKRPVMADIMLDQASEQRVAEYYSGKYKRSDVAPGAYNAEDFFPDLGEDGKWLFFTAAPIKDNEGKVVGAIETLQDITEEKRVIRQNEAMLRISQSLHEHMDLEGLLDYICNEIKSFLETEGAAVGFLEEETEELYFIGSAYEDPEKGRRVKEVRFSLDQLAAGKVIKSGEPLIINESSDVDSYPVRDRKLGYQLKNLIIAPIKTEDRIIGVLSAINKTEGHFGTKDIDLLNMVAGTVALSIENARFSEEVKEAYREVSSLNSAKGRTIDHLSHELRTPLQSLTMTMDLLRNELKPIPEERWKHLIDMAQRSLIRIKEIQEETADIMQDREYKSYGLIRLLFDQCSDVLAGLFAGECGNGRIVENVKERIEEDFGLREAEPRKICVDEFIEARVRDLKPQFSHRKVDIFCSIEPDLSLYLPEDTLKKIVDGLIKNAVENTPDQGRIEVRGSKKGGRVELIVHDFGIGIAEEHWQKIFQGYLPTQDLMEYSTKRPFDFYAGGKGADLLRIKMFSEKFNFKISMESEYCPHINFSGDGHCPGIISRCSACKKTEDCYAGGGTAFTLYFQ